MKLSIKDFAIIGVMMLIISLAVYFLTKETVVTVDANGNVEGISHVRKSIGASPKVPKVGSSLLKKKEEPNK